VNKVPLLALPWEDRRNMPPLCCACGAPAARTERLRIIRVEFAFDLDAPHCALHTGGADLDSEPVAGKGTSPGAGAEGEVLCVLSGLRKGQLSMHDVS